MPLDLPDGSACFVDANIFYYALVPTPPVSEPCLQLLNRAMAGRVSFMVSASVLSDAVHKVMISEAAQISGRDRAGMIGFLGKHPEIIGQLVEYPKVMERLRVVPMTILPIDAELVASAINVAMQCKLLTNDAMIVALMQLHQLTHLVTNDDDFDGILGLTIWKPR